MYIYIYVYIYIYIIANEPLRVNDLTAGNKHHELDCFFGSDVRRDKTLASTPRCPFVLFVLRFTA